MCFWFFMPLFLSELRVGGGGISQIKWHEFELMLGEGHGIIRQAIGYKAKSDTRLYV